MYDMDRINALLGLSSNENLGASIAFMDGADASAAVNIATEVPQTIMAYGHALSRLIRDADIDRSEVERYLS